MANHSVTDKIVCSGALVYSRHARRFLLIQKAHGKHEGTWGLVGGTNHEDENPWHGLQREIQEEIGFVPQFIKTMPLETFVSNDNVFNFHTYFCIIDDEFIPTLSSEHTAWGWFDLHSLPKPLHSGLSLSLRNKIIQAKIQTIIDILDIV